MGRRSRSRPFGVQAKYRPADMVQMSSPAVAQLPVGSLRVRPRLVEGPVPAVLDGLGPRWTRVDRVPFGSTVDIEHVLLSTAGVFVVETETSRTPDLGHAISETRWRARKIGFLLDRVGRVRVTPVLVVSGRGAPAIAGGYETVDGVLVCRAAEAARWCAHLESLPPTLELDAINPMLDVLVDHTLRTDEINRTFA
jgi:hypothetical protein